ncbi:hypothetical protein LWI29_023522 [Acer saccharum]|uniref:SHSP domain-containing protein n=1 Tax=Acer saccharum TaxID=4024 RepID=A0AA39VSD6_ACESA|nr:hypothetical protein LWI29_023522 [Acer saccharum]KAK1576794.1 hypothetical protein Q3G72_016543 [Acer saccharum]KAK1583821.1 hypothetical protein Q3G72_027249 [Acer saccharum]
MALARLALMRSLQQRVSSSSSSSCVAVQRERWNNELLKRFMSTTSAPNEDNKDTKDKEKEVSVTENKKSSKLFPKRKSKKSLWRNNDIIDVPALYEFFPSGLGNALLQATENLNKLFSNISPAQLMGRVKEEDECYKLRFEVPGLSKEEVKITIEDGVLNIEGEHKEEAEEKSDGDEFWSSKRFGYYNTSLVLPDDAKVDDINAELKDGVLNVTIPRTEKPKKDVKQVQIH